MTGWLYLPLETVLVHDVEEGSQIVDPDVVLDVVPDVVLDVDPDVVPDVDLDDAGPDGDPSYDPRLDPDPFLDPHPDPFLDPHPDPSLGPHQDPFLGPHQDPSSLDPPFCGPHRDPCDDDRGDHPRCCTGVGHHLVEGVPFPVEDFVVCCLGGVVGSGLGVAGWGGVDPLC